MANTKDLLEKIARYKSAMEAESDPDTKKKYQNRIETLEKEIQAAEVAVEKQEEKIEKKEDKALEEAEKKLNRYKDAMEAESDPDTKAKYKKRIEDLENQLKGVKEQIKEEKQEIAEQKKDIKEAVQEVQSAQKTIRTQAIKKGGAQAAARKAITGKKKARSKKITNIISKLDKLIKDNPALSTKYDGARGGSYMQYSKVDLKRDAGRASKPFGYRFKGKNNMKTPRPDQRGQSNVYYESRANRADVYPKRKYKLDDGGELDKGYLENYMDSGLNLEVQEYMLAGQPNPDIFGYFENMYDFVSWVKKTVPPDNFNVEVDSEYSRVFFEGDKEDLDEFLTALLDAAKKDKPGMDEDVTSGLPKYNRYKMADGGKTQGYDDKEDERLGMQDKKISTKDFVGSHSKKEHSRRDDARFEERGRSRRYSDGGVVLKLYETGKDWKTNNATHIEFDDFRSAKKAGERSDVFEFEIVDGFSGDTMFSTHGEKQMADLSYEKGGDFAKGGVVSKYDQWAKNIYDNQSEEQAIEGLIQFARENGFEYRDVEKALQVYKYDTEENAFGEQYYTKKAIRGMISMIADEMAEEKPKPEPKKRGPKKSKWVWKAGAEQKIPKSAFKKGPTSAYLRKTYKEFVEKVKN